MAWGTTQHETRFFILNTHAHTHTNRITSAQLYALRPLIGLLGCVRILTGYKAAAVIGRSLKGEGRCGSVSVCVCAVFFYDADRFELKKPTALWSFHNFKCLFDS